MEFNIFDYTNEQQERLLKHAIISIVNKRMIKKKMIEEKDFYKINKKLNKIILENISLNDKKHIMVIEEQITTIEEYIKKYTHWNLHYKNLNSKCWAETRSKLKYHISGEYKEYLNQGKVYLDQEGNLFYPNCINSDFYSKQRKNSKDFSDEYYIMLLQYFNLNKRKIKLLKEAKLKEGSKLTKLEYQCLLFLTDQLENKEEVNKYYRRQKSKTKYKLS